MNRRNFLRATTGLTAAAAGAAAQSLFTSEAAAAATATGLSANPLCIFNKPLQHLSYDALADLMKEIGVAGIEGTVRKGGHVESERVEEDLPRQIEALKQRGLEMTIMTSDVTDAENELHQRVLKTAASLGVKRFRMGSYRLAGDRPIPQQIDEITRKIEGLVAFCRDLKITPTYQNHSGAGHFGAAIWDLHQVIASYPVEEMASAFDIRHASVEGGLSWPTEFQLMRPHVGIVYIKDYVWDGPKARNVPLGEGRVEPRFFTLLKKSGYTGPISLHMEYGQHKDHSVMDANIPLVRKDLDTLKRLLAEA